ncbi:MAG: cobalamin biosynthesis protein [Rhodobacteraceae bacterium]|nr:cobalamin biosynthesis protein [Paracoccaceae bacterium]
MTHFDLLLLALLLDALIGEPPWLWARVPHPVTIMGQIITWFDVRLNIGTAKKRNGAITTGILVAAALALGYLLKLIPDFGALECLLAAILIAQKSLTVHVSNVAKALDQDLESGKKAVSLIVGRDTKDMTETAVARGAIESAAENFSDGVIAPAFWFLVLGLPGILAYKIINTADSMIGHKSDKYLHFGWAAARLDDLVNLIPARLSALLICAATLSPKAWTVTRQDARQHRSPNAGWPEAAMAGALDISLSGPRSYGGVMGTDLYVNHNGRRDLTAADIRAAVTILWRAWAVFGLIVLILAVIF